MPALKTLLLVISAALLALSLGFFAYHYVTVTNQYFRMIMM
jgi:hypothetical protein